MNERGVEIALFNATSEITSLVIDKAIAETKDEFYKRIQNLAQGKQGAAKMKLLK